MSKRPGKPCLTLKSAGDFFELNEEAGKVKRLFTNVHTFTSSVTSINNNTNTIYTILIYRLLFDSIVYNEYLC